MSINFSHNWNGKLRQDVFTTIRRYTPEKWDFYNNQIGQQLEIRLNGQYIIRRELFYIGRMKFQTIPFPLLYLDTGLTDPNEVHALFAKFGIKDETEVIVLCLRKT